jgi:hypothetical protein
MAPGGWTIDAGDTDCNFENVTLVGNVLSVNIENDVHADCTVDLNQTATATSTVTTTPATATPTATSTPGGTPTKPLINFPMSACLGGIPSNQGNVTFSWTGAANTTDIYVDLTVFDNGFAPGTFLTIRVNPGTNSLQWNGLIAGVPHFWRVRAANGATEVQSDWSGFVPCGTQRILEISYVCTGGGRATVFFRWAPTSSPGFVQWVDISLFNNGFAPGTFLGAGPLSPTEQGFAWQNILANATHFARVNTSTILGWGPSQTVSFFPSC